MKTQDLYSDPMSAYILLVNLRAFHCDADESSKKFLRGLRTLNTSCAIAN